MANNPPQESLPTAPQQRPFGRIRTLFLITLSTLLGLILIYSWVTRDAMANLPFLQRSSASAVASRKNLVDLRPWQTAQALAPLAITAEEIELAHEAERLADHEVDQAFAAALRQARANQRTLTGEALALSQRVVQLQQLVKDDQAQIQNLTAARSPAANQSVLEPSSSDLEIAKQQLGLDQDQLNDAQQDLARASGDERTRIQQELTAHEASMAKYDAQAHQQGEVAVISAQQYRTLAHLISAWSSQRTRYQLTQQAQQQTQADVATLTAQHNALEAKANATTAPSDQTSNNESRLTRITQQRELRQLLSIYDDRIQTDQQLANVYSRWSTQLWLQHRIVLHLILRGFALVALILIITMLCDAFIGRLLDRPTLDRRRKQTLHTILQLGIQIIGGLVVIFIIFGTPSQMPTIIGLATAGLTVVLQDFILAFFGWFVLMGKNGIRVGDIVEINGVSGEVAEIGLFRTALFETGNWTDTGHPTGRRVTFINSFAIRGQYFNFSTTGQWMWDEITVSIPASNDTYTKIEQIHQVVLKQTEKNAKLAEAEWKRPSLQYGLNQFSATPAVNLRPASSGVDIIVRYITRASDRFETRNSLYQSILDVLRNPETAPAHPAT